jgi:hypothetical protein
MANIGTLAVSLVAKTKKFESGMRKAKGTMTAFAKATAVLGMVTTAFGAMSAAISQASTEIDRLAKAGRALGVTYQEMRKLDIMSKMLGVDAGKLNSAFRAWSKHKFQAGMGMAESVRMFNAAGINPKTLTGDMVSQLTQVATAIGKMEDSSQRLAVASRLLGESGGILAGNADGLAAAAERAEKAADGLTEAQVRSVELANDEWTRLWSTVGAAWNQMAGVTAEIRANMYGAAADALSEDSRKLTFEQIDAAIRYGSRDAIDPKILADFDRMVFFDIMKASGPPREISPISPKFDLSGGEWASEAVEWGKASGTEYAEAFESALSQALTHDFISVMHEGVRQGIMDEMQTIEGALGQIERSPPAQVWCLEEIGEIITRFPELVLAKDAFPEAEVIQLRTSDRVHDALNDSLEDIPW